MLAQEKKIKGLTLLEVLIVLAIIGVVSGVAYPNFRDWRSSRIVKDEVQRAKSLFQAITAQVKRGQYAYVQAQVFVEEDKITLTSKGMNTSHFTDLFNSEWWDTNIPLRCQIANTLGDGSDSVEYWDDVGGGEKVEVMQIVLEKTTTDLAEGNHAICFSKTGKYYNGQGALDGANNLILCKRTTTFSRCSMADGIPASKDLELVHSIDWTRFGEISVDKWTNATATRDAAWVLQ